MTYLFLHPIMHLLLFLSPDWLTFCHVIISYKFTRFFIYFLFLSDERPMLETLDHTIRIGSTRPFCISICISTLPTQHTMYIVKFFLEEKPSLKMLDIYILYSIYRQHTTQHIP